MKIPSLIMLLLISDLFIKSNQASSLMDTKGRNCKFLQACDKNTSKNRVIRWRPDKTAKSQYMIKPSADSDAVECKKSQTIYNAKCSGGIDNPEEWFVKTFNKPYTDPQKYIFFSVKQNNNTEIVDENTTCVDCPESIGKETEDFPTHITKVKTNIIEECTKCTLQTENDRLILKCTPILQGSKKCARSSKLKPTLILYVKFLQINGPEHSRKSIIQSLMDKNQFKSPNRKI